VTIIGNSFKTLRLSFLRRHTKKVTDTVNAVFVWQNIPYRTENTLLNNRYPYRSQYIQFFAVNILTNIKLRDILLYMVNVY